jgi:hypothetical protein
MQLQPTFLLVKYSIPVAISLDQRMREDPLNLAAAAPEGGLAEFLV